jgi:hypothetical protein
MTQIIEHLLSCFHSAEDVPPALALGRARVVRVIVNSTKVDYGPAWSAATSERRADWAGAILMAGHVS